jgi:hypothetical protein
MRITIENFPPIASGSFELRPLTLFIGPNNTGKSRAGLLTWAVARAMSAPFVSSAFPDRRTLFVREPGTALYDRPDWRDALVGEFAEFVRKAIDESLPSAIEAIAARSQAPANARVALKRPNDQAIVTVHASPNAWVVTNKLVDPQRDIRLWDDFWKRVDERYVNPADWRNLPDNAFWRDLRRSWEFPVGDAFYLPAGRGAFASTWTFLAGLAFRGAATPGSGALPAATADFLGWLSEAASRLAAAKPGHPELNSAITLIEEALLEGRVTAAGSPSVPFPFVFSSASGDDGVRFDVDFARASSSVNELGPLVAMMKTVVKPGDLVVIDEPEAHLHPENHRLIAHVLVRLANAGVYVIAPTHSSTIIHQVSNLVRASNLDPKRREQLGLEADDVIPNAAVGVYDFRRGDRGAVISEVPFDEEYGYPEEEFYDVAKDLITETANIDLALPAAS